MTAGSELAASGAEPSGASGTRTSVPVASSRILHVHAGNMYGGVETFFRTMAEQGAADPAARMDFALCFDGRIASELRQAGARVHILGDVRVRSPRQVTAARTELARILGANGYRVVVCHSAWPHAIFSTTVRRAGARLVHMMHDVPNRLGWLDRWASRHPPDLVICNSAFTEVSGRWLFPNTPRRTIYCPVRLGREGGAADRERVRAALGTPASAVVVLHASRMQEWKGQRLLVRALAEIRSNPRWLCWLAGAAQRPEEAAYEKRLRAEVEASGLSDRVRFLGQRDDVPDLMRAADIHCQPNEGPEPFGITFVEALAAGLPVVTTAMGGPLEIVDPSCGVLVKPGDVRALAAALEELIEDGPLRAALSKAGPPRARLLCDPHTRTLEMVTELSPLVSEPADVLARASASRGLSNDVIHSAVATALRARGEHFDSIVDLGCGRGDCARSLRGLYDAYLGCDVVQYEDFPRSPSVVEFREVDLNRPPYPVADASAVAVVSIETIEHVENARAMVREMARIVRPGGVVVVTTPNQISLVSKLYLVVKDQFHAFQAAPGLYPAHITALVPEDLRRIAAEAGLQDIEIRYTDRGRIPLSTLHWPAAWGARGAWFSDNVVMVARRASRE